MRITYKGDMPIARITVKGPRGERECDGYLDTGARRTLIPEKDAVELGLPYAGDTQIITGSGKDTIRVYRATVTFFEKDFSILVFGRDLPEQATVKTIVGRDILDNYEVCFDGKAKEIEILP